MAGVHYLHLTGVRSGDRREAGKTDYGSLGQYFVSGTVAPAACDPVSIQPLDASQLEGDVGMTDFSFVVMRTSNTEVAISVNCSATGSLLSDDLPPISGVTVTPIMFVCRLPTGAPRLMVEDEILFVSVTQKFNLAGGAESVSASGSRFCYPRVLS